MNQTVNINNYFLEYLKKKKIIFIIYCLLLIVYPLQRIYLPQYYGKIISNLNSNKNKFMNDVKILIFLFILIQILHLFSSVIQGFLLPEFLNYSTVKVFNYLINLNELDYENIEIGSTISKIAKIPTVAFKYFDIIKSLFFSQIIIFIFSIHHYYKLSKNIAFSFIFIIIGLFIIQYITHKLTVKIEVEREEQRDIFTDFLYDIFNNLISIIICKQNKNEEINISKKLKPYIKIFYKLINIDFIIGIINSLFNIFSFILLNYLLYKNFINKNISKEQFISSFIVTYSILTLFYETSATFKHYTDAKAKLKDVEQFFNNKFINDKNIINENTKFNNGEIIFKNVDFKYNDISNNTLKNINLNIKQNENIAIIGHTGSGKSTVIKLLLKFIKPTNGEIFINNININKISKNELYSYIFYIPQKPKLLDRTLYENLIYGLNIKKNNKENTINKIINILKDINIEDNIINTFIEKINTNVGRDGSKMSGGQKQIVWIIRALLRNSNVIIFDEPTASIDKKNKQKIFEIIKKVGQNKTIIVITHDEIDNDFRKIKIHNGEIVNNNNFQLLF